MIILSGKELRDVLEEEIEASLLMKGISFYLYSDKESLPAGSYLHGVKKILDRFEIPYKEGFIDKNASAKVNMNAFVAQSKGRYAVIARPLGVQYEDDLINKMDPDYDPDMMTIANRGHLYDGDLTCLPAIVQAVKTIVTDYALNLEGKKCLIVGRSHSVGMPLFQYFLSSNAATTVVHSKVSNEVINAMASEADIIVLASGHPGIIKRTSYRPTQTVIDCGFSAGGGDLGFIPNEGELEAYTPVPGGVGALTSYCLLLNAIALEKRKNLAHY